MKHKISLFFILLSLILGLSGTVNTRTLSIHAADRVNDPAGGILLYLEDFSETDSYQEMTDVYLSSQSGKGAEWFIIALKQYHKGLDFGTYTKSLDTFIREGKISQVTQKQLLSLSLIFMDQKEDPFIQTTADTSIGENGLMSFVYGLHLLNNGIASEEHTKESLTEYLLSQRKKDGGWSLIGDNADVDVTSMVLMALAPYIDENPEVGEAVETALKWLSEKQLDSGGYAGFGSENAESTAQVMTALSTLQIDPEKDNRFIKNNHTLTDALLQFRLPDGSFSHIKDGPTNMTATTQAFYAFVSLWRVKNGLGPLFVYNPAENFADNPGEEKREPASADNQNTPDTEPENPTENKKAGYKIYALSFVILLFIIIVTIQFFIRKKRNFKNYLSPLLFTLIAVILIVFTDIKSTDNYYHGDDKEKNDVIGTVSLSIRCDTIVGKGDSPYIPKDGIILDTTEFSIEKGDTVYDVLMEAARKYEIQVENKGGVMSAHGMTFISGINYLYEFDFGDLSGWVYHVNQVSPSVGCGEYVLKDGDLIEWLYTCDLGNDVQ